MTSFGCPEVLVDIHRRFVVGDIEGAWALFHHWMPLVRYEAKLPLGGIGIRKQLLVERGVIAGSTARRPVSAGAPRSLGELQALVGRLSAAAPFAAAPGARP